jgi:hypothetical protein
MTEMTHLLEFILPALEFEVGADLGVLKRKLLHLGAVEIVQDPRVDLAGELRE